MFKPVETNINFPKQELAIGQFWKENRIYEKSLEQRAARRHSCSTKARRPPTACPTPATASPARSKTSSRATARCAATAANAKPAGTPTACPVEVEVCKELGIHSKEEIEAYGIEPFIQKCQQSVWRYMQEWERHDRPHRLLGRPRKTPTPPTTKATSKASGGRLKNLYDRGLLYQGHKIVWWWAQGGTALSAGEVGEGYRSVADPSVYVKFPLLDDAGKRNRHVAARLDHHALDAAQQPIRRRPSGP